VYRIASQHDRRQQTFDDHRVDRVVPGILLRAPGPRRAPSRPPTAATTAETPRGRSSVVAASAAGYSGHSEYRGCDRASKTGRGQEAGGHVDAGW